MFHLPYHHKGKRRFGVGYYRYTGDLTLAGMMGHPELSSGSGAEQVAKMQSAGLLGTGPSSWFSQALSDVGNAITPLIKPAVGTIAGIMGLGALTEVVPPAVSNVVDTIQPYTGGLNFGSIMPGAVTQADPAPSGPTYTDQTTFMNPPVSPSGGYSTAAYFGRRYRRRRGSYRIMRRSRRRRRY